MSPAGARGLVLASAVLFSTAGAAIKTGAFTAAQVSGCRSGIAALVLLAYTRGHIRLTGLAVLAACLYAATLTLYVAATKATTAANAVFLQAAAPVYLLVLGPVVLRETWSRQDLVHVGALAAGMVLCLTGQDTATVTAPNDGLTPVIVGNAIAALIALPTAWPLPEAPVAAWATLIYLGVFQVGLAYACLARAIRHVPALEASLLLLLEPVLNPIWTWLVRGEMPGPATLLGGAIIVLATAVRATRAAPGIA